MNRSNNLLFGDWSRWVTYFIMHYYWQSDYNNHIITLTCLFITSWHECKINFVNNFLNKEKINCADTTIGILNFTITVLQLFYKCSLQRFPLYTVRADIFVQTRMMSVMIYWELKSSFWSITPYLKSSLSQSMFQTWYLVEQTFTGRTLVEHAIHRCS